MQRNQLHQRTPKPSQLLHCACSKNPSKDIARRRSSKTGSARRQTARARPGPAGRRRAGAQNVTSQTGHVMPRWQLSGLGFRRGLRFCAFMCVLARFSVFLGRTGPEKRFQAGFWPENGFPRR